jgi:hypothetical protein
LKVRIQSRPLRNFHNTKNIMGGVRTRETLTNSSTPTTPLPFTADAGSFLCATQVAPHMHAKRASSLNVERSETTPPSPKFTTGAVVCASPIRFCAVS